jgi:peptide/nickel transport system permease protein
MIQYLIKRILLMVVTLFGIIVVTFAITRLAPGDPVSMQADSIGQNANNQAMINEVVRERKRIYGLDKPMFLNWHFEERGWFVRDALRRAVDRGEDSNENERKIARRELQDVATAAYPDLIPILGELDGEQLTTALESLVASTRHELPPGFAQLPAAKQIEYWTEYWGIFVPNGGEWEQYAEGLVEDALTKPTPILLAELDRVGPMATPALYRAVRRAASDAERSRALNLLARIERTPAYRADARFVADELTNDYIPSSGPTREPLRQKLVTAIAPETQRAVAAEGASALAADADFWHLPTLIGYYFEETDPTRQAAFGALIADALSPEARAALPEAAQLRRWPDAADLLEDMADAKEAQFGRSWQRDRFRYLDYGFVAHSWNLFANTQFGIWVGKILRFDFDNSIKYNRPVLELIAERLPITLTLSFVSIFISYLIAIPLGIYSATHYHTFGDKLSTLLLFILYSLPTFWVGEMMILYFSNPQFIDIFPSHGLGDPSLTFAADGFVWLKDRAMHLALPIICYTYASFAFLSRQMRSSMLETIRQDFIRTARAKGLSNGMVIYKHALRNSLIPILTLAANLLPALISGSVILEMVFTIEGMGKLAVDAVFARDYAVINAIAVFSAALTLLGILLSDLSYALVDPRITYE